MYPAFLSSIFPLETNMRTILKLQKPLSSSEANPPVLVYDKDRSFDTMIEMTPEEMLHLFAGKPKVYVKAEVDMDDKSITILGKVADQPW